MKKFITTTEKFIILPKRERETQKRVFGIFYIIFVYKECYLITNALQYTLDERAHNKRLVRNKIIALYPK